MRQDLPPDQALQSTGQLTVRHNRLLRASALLTAILMAGSPTANQAFSYVGQGDDLPDMVLPQHGGGKASYLGDDTHLARVFAFVKGDHVRSADVLTELAALITEFEGRSVSWSLVVSDRHGGAWADSVAAAVPAAVVLIDTGDQLYAALGVALTPSVGLGTADGILHAYLPYQKIHYGATIRGHLQYLLGDIDATELAHTLQPTRDRVTDTAEAGCLRSLKLATMLIKMGKADKALIQVENVLGECPEMAEAYTTLAEIRRLQGDEAAALVAERRATDLIVSGP